MIRIENVCKVYGRETSEAIRLLSEGGDKAWIFSQTGAVVAVNSTTVELSEGEILVVMGLSGSGKSTLLRCVNRLVEPTSGRIFLNDGKTELEVTTLSRSELQRVRRDKISMVFQSFALFPHRSILQNVTYGLEGGSLTRSKRREKAYEILSVVGLEQWADRYPSQLSGGMQQRVGLARALVTDAPILLMDEPFGQLDPLIRIRMQDEFLSLQQQYRRSVLFVTHDLDEALRIGSRIGLMQDGRLVQVGTPEDIVCNPQTQYVAEFARHANRLNVLTAATVAVRKLASTGVDDEYAFCGDPDRPIVCRVDKQGVPGTCYIRGKPYPVRKVSRAEINALPDPLDVEACEVFAVDARLKLAEIVRIRARSSSGVLLVCEEDRLEGLIGDREIYGALTRGDKL